MDYDRAISTERRSRTRDKYVSLYIVTRLAGKEGSSRDDVPISHQLRKPFAFSFFFLNPTKCPIAVHLLAYLMPAAAAQVHSHDMWRSFHHTQHENSHGKQGVESSLLSRRKKKKHRTHSFQSAEHLREVTRGQSRVSVAVETERSKENSR